MKRPIANNNLVAKECIFSPKVKNKTRMSAFTTSANTVLDDTIRQRKLTGCRDSPGVKGAHCSCEDPGSGHCTHVRQLITTAVRVSAQDMHNLTPTFS